MSIWSRKPQPEFILLSPFPSRLSDRDIKEKVQTFGNGNLGAKRQIMYKMSQDSEETYTWNKEKIKRHYNNIMQLIEKRVNILKVLSVQLHTVLQALV